MILKIKLIYSEEIVEKVPEEKKQYFYDLLNSIPNDILKSRNPHTLMKNGKKLNGFLSSILKELETDGIDTTDLHEKLERNNKEYIKLIRGF